MKSTVGSFSYGIIYENKKYFVEVDSKVNITRKDLKKILEAAFQDPEFKSVQDKKLSITSKTTYACNGHEHSIEETPSLHKITKLFRLAQEPLSKRIRTFNEIKESLLAELSPSTPIEHFFCDLGVTIAAAFIRLFNPGKVYDLSQISYLNDGNGRFSLEMAMKDISTLCKEGSKKEKALGVHLEQGIDWAKTWHSEPERRIPLLNEIVDSISEKEMVYIPSGSWGEDGLFSPTLITLKREHGKIVLQDIGYGETAEHAKRVIFSDSERAKPVLSGLLSLSTVQIETTEEIQKNVFEKIVDFINTHLPMLSICCLKPEIELPKLPLLKQQLSVETFKTILYDSYAEDVQTAVTARKTIQKDPLKIIHEVIIQSHPELSLADKTLFALQIAHMQALRVVAAIPQMSQEEKKQWITKMESQIQSLSRSLEVEGATSEEISEVLSQLKGTIEEIRLEAVRVTEKTIAIRQKGLNSIAETRLNLAVSMKKPETVEPAKPTSMSRLTESGLQKLEAIEASFHSLDRSHLPVLAKQITTVSQAIDTLVEMKQYELASNSAHQALSRLPLPGGLKTNIIDNISSFSSAELKETFYALDTISKELGKIAHCFWESKFRQEEMKLLPENVVEFMNIEAFLLETIETQKTLIEALPPDERSSYERAFIAVEEVFRKNPLTQSVIDYNDSFLRLQENPGLTKKYVSLGKYCWNQRVGEAKRTKQERSDEENAFCEAALKAYSVDSTEKLYRLELDFFQGQDYAAPQVPAAFRDLSRIRLLYGSMYYPESSISFNAITPTGLIRGIGTMISTANDISKHPEHIGSVEHKNQKRRDLFLEATQEFKSASRIEISKVSGAPLYGIIEKGQEGFFPSFVIDPLGLTEIQEVASIRATPNNRAHFDQLGSPRIFGARSASWHPAEALNNALNTEDESPVEVFHMNRYAGRQGAVQQVIDSLINRPWAIDKELKTSSASTKRGFEVQKSDYDLLFSGGMTRALTWSPEYFLSRVDLLKQTLDEAIQNKRFEQAFFLGYVINTITANLKTIDPSTVSQDKLQDFQRLQQLCEATFPLNGVETLIDLWTDEACEGQPKIDGAVYLMRTLSNSYCTGESIEQWLKKDSKTVKNLFALAEFNGIVENAATIPLLSQQAQLWFKEGVVPEILKLPKERQGELFDIWAENKKINNKSGVWEKTATSFIWKKNDLQIDLLGLQLFSEEASSSSLIKTKLPSFVTQNRDYESIFYGRALFASIRPGKVLGEMVYSFTDHGIEYEARVNQSVKSCELTRRRKGESGWSLFVLPQSSKAEGIEKSLIRSGIWIDSANKASSTLYPGRCYTKGSCEVTLQLSQKGKVEKVFTTDGFQVMQPEKDLYPASLACLPRDQLLFLKRRGESFISEIRLVGESIVFKRTNPNDSWKVYGDDRCNGLSWNLSQDTNQTSPFAYLFLKKLGANVEEVGFTVGGPSATTFLFWPQKITDSKTAPKGTFTKLSFDKQPHSIPPLEVTWKENGKMSGSSVGFLGLAYFLGGTKEYTKAFDLLDKAKGAKIGSKDDFEHLKQLQQLFQEMTIDSAQSALLRVKALLSIRKIIQQQTLQQPFSKEEWKGFLSLSQNISHAYKDFEAYVKKSPLGKKEAFYKEAFSLSEAKELDSVMRESLQFLLEEAKQETKNGGLLSPDKEELRLVIPQLLKRAKEPLSDEQLIASLSLRSNVILDHFLDLYNLIAKSGDSIKDHQMTPLFVPIRDTNQEEIATIDVARRLLLSAWHAKKADSKGITLVSLKQMEALEIFLPEPRVEILPTGFKVTTNTSIIPEAAKNVFKKENEINLSKLKAVLKDDPSLFGPIATPIIEEIILTTELQNAITGHPVSCEALISTIEGKTSINLVEQIRKKEVQKRISVLEETVEKAKALPNKSKEISVTFTQEDLPPKYESFGKPIEASLLVGNLEQLKSGLKNQLTDQGLKNGLDKASVGLQEKLENKKYFEKEDLPKFANRIMSLLEQHKNEKARLRGQILEKVMASKEALPSQVQDLVSKQEELGVERIMEALKKTYQLLEIEDPTLVKEMTLFLMHEASEKILSRNITSQLEILSKLSVDRSNSQTILEWQSLSSKVVALFEQSENFSRYIENNLLKDPALTCKLLALEASQGIICTKEQIDLIKKIVANPEEWYELKVGLGKTSVVFPIVLLMLLEKGEFPSAIVKDELLQENLDSLDRSTRELLEQAGIAFTFRLNDPFSLSAIQEQYLRLLESRVSKSYPITTLASLIDLDEKAQLLMKERIVLLEALQKKLVELNISIDINQILCGTIDTDSLQALEPCLVDLIAIHSITESLAYIGKVRDQFDFLFFDEADDILNVLFERNVSIGAPEPLDPTIQETMKHIMRVIFISDNKHLQAFKMACRQSRQASLEEDFIEEKFIPALCQALLEDTSYLQMVGDISTIDKKVLQKQLYTTFTNKNETIEFPDITQDQRKHFGALQRILQSTLKMAARQNPGINTGIKTSDGFQVGPKLSGQEQVGTIFGDEYDLIVNHYFSYGTAIPEVVAEGLERSFVAIALSQIHQQYPETYKIWETKALEKGQTILQFLNEIDNIEERLEFTQKALFLELRLKVFKKQISYNVQHRCYDCRFGGMTGTLAREALPKAAGQTHEESTKQVTATVLLEAALLADPVVSRVEETEQSILNRMSERFSDHVAIINQGFDIKQGNTEEVIASLRQNHRDKTFVFVDSRTRKDMIWMAGEEKPAQVTKAFLNELAIDPQRKNSLRFFYSPPDIRGVDRRIPPGKATTFLGPGCSMDDFVQALGRMREAGTCHSMNFELGDGIIARIRSSQGLSKEASVSYSHLVQDISEQMFPQQLKKDLKTAVEEMNAIVKNGTRAMLFGSTKRVPGESAYPSEELLLHMSIDNKLMAIANHPETGWLEEDKTLKVAESFAPTVLEEQLECIKRTAEAQKKKIKQLEEVIGQLTPAEFPNMSYPEVEKAYDSHLEYLQGVLGTMYKNLENTEKRIIAILEDPEQKIYPLYSPSNGSALPQTLAQIQEQSEQQQQVQQQQQQQLAQSKSFGAQGIPEPLSFEFYSMRCPEWINPPPNAPNLGLPERIRAKVLEALQPFGDYLGDQLEITHHSLQLFGIAQGFKGDPEMCQIDFIKAPYRLQIIANEEFDSEIRMPPRNFGGDTMKVGLFSIAKDGKLLLNKYEGGFDKGEEQLAELMQPPHVKKIACAKWLMGYSKYSEEEKEELKKFFSHCAANPDRANLNGFMENYATQEQKELMRAIS